MVAITPGDAAVMKRLGETAGGRASVSRRNASHIPLGRAQVRVVDLGDGLRRVADAGRRRAAAAGQHLRVGRGKSIRSWASSRRLVPPEALHA